MRISYLVAASFALSLNAPAMGQEDVSTKKLSYALLPEGKTLPTGVARFRLPYQVATGSESYDKDGNKSDSIVKFSAAGGAFVAEYGLTDKVSLQWRTDFAHSQKTEVNKSSKAYSDAMAAAYASNTKDLATATKTTITSESSLANAIATAFIGACVKASQGTQETCTTAYQNGTMSSASASAINLANSFGQGSSSVTAKDYATRAAAGTEAKISSGIATIAESKGGSGMGDTTLGVLYEAYDSGAVFVALAGGVRVPTGNRDLSSNELDSTRGAWEVGGRINVDMLPLDWFMVSWQNQSEVGVAGTTRKKAGVSIDTKRDGVRNVGFVYLKPSLEALVPGLESLRASLGVTYDFDSAEQTTIGGVESTAPRSEMIWNYASLGYSFLTMKLPLQLDVEYEMPNRGKNAAIAATKTTFTAKAFARF
jgi:hypothetical protein